MHREVIGEERYSKLMKELQKKKFVSDLQSHVPKVVGVGILAIVVKNLVRKL